MEATLSPCHCCIKSPESFIISHVTTTVVLPARLAPSDSVRLVSPWRALGAILVSLLHALARDPVQDLVRRVDRMSIRWLLTRVRNALQPDSTWTINWVGRVQTPYAKKQVNPPRGIHRPGSNDKPPSRAPRVVESPTPRIRAEHDETRTIDQRGAARDAGRDSGGRRPS
jgi:hypothetical protein